MYVFRHILALTLILLSVLPVLAGDRPVIVDDGFRLMNISDHLSYFEDPDGKATPSDITGPGINWKQLRQDSISFGYTRSTWWFRFRADDRSTGNREIWLKIDNPLLDHIELYSPIGGTLKRLVETGDQFPVDSRGLKTNRFCLRLQLHSGENTYYLKIRTTSSLNFRLKLLTLVEQLQEEMRENALVLFLAGWMILLALYNLFVFIVIQSKEVILFVALVCSLLILRLTSLGYTSLYLLPPAYNNISIVFIILSVVISSSYFIQYYFNAKTDFAGFYRILQWGIKYPSFATLILSPFLSYRFILVVANLLGAFITLLFFVFAVYGSVRRVKKAYFIFIGFGIILVAVLLDALNLFGLVPRTEVFDWLYNTGLAWLMLFSSLGLAHQLNLMNRELRKREHIIDSSSSAIVTAELDGRVEFVNPAFLVLWGYSNPEEIRGKEHRNIWFIDWRFKRFIRDLEDTGTWTGELTARHRDGTLFDVQVSAAVVTDNQGQPTGYMSSAVNITERKKAEAALKASEEKYKTVIENANEAIVVLQGNHVTFFNPKTRRFSGYTDEEILSTPFLEFVHPEDRQMISDNFVRALDGENVQEVYTCRIIGKRGNIIWCELKPVIINWNSEFATLCFINDITERKQTQELMIQSEKMMSLGRLTAGTAHELNNPLAGILQGVQNIQRRLSPSLAANRKIAQATGIDLEKLQLYLKQRDILFFFEGIREAGHKASHIISNMLQFSRKSESQMAPTDPVSLLDKVLELANKDYDLKKKHDFKRVNINKAYDPDLPLVPCNETEIEQVLLNLLGNAAWAMSNDRSNHAPEIWLRIKREHRFLRIEVEDNGPGMDEETRKSIFEPFFTTKPVGEGTGLGLSVSYSLIAHNHKGTLEVESAVGKGTKFIIRLPLEREPSAGTTSPHPT